MEKPARYIYKKKSEKMIAEVDRLLKTRSRGSLLR